MKDSASEAHEEAHKGCTHMRSGTISNKQEIYAALAPEGSLTKSAYSIGPRVKDEQKFYII
jgi:hypothetical protein